MVDESSPSDPKPHPILVVESLLESRISKNCVGTKISFELAKSIPVKATM